MQKIAEMMIQMRLEYGDKTPERNEKKWLASGMFDLAYR
jgi:hypothetical protein